LPREDLPKRRSVIGRIRPVLDPAVATEERVEKLRAVTNRVDAGPRRLEPLVHHHATSDLETGRLRKFDVRLNADAGDDEVGAGRDVGGVEPQVDAVL